MKACSLSMQCFAIKEWVLVYWEVSRNKVVNKYRFISMLLDDD